MNVTINNTQRRRENRNVKGGKGRDFEVVIFKGPADPGCRRYDDSGLPAATDVNKHSKAPREQNALTNNGRARDHYVVGSTPKHCN
jgi:hypothetical protein